MNFSLLLYAFIFAFAVWLGLYLIARDPRKPRLRYTGLGLLSYAFGFALDSLTAYSTTSDLTAFLIQLRWPLLFVPALCWFAAAVDLLPEDMTLRARLSRVTTYGLPLAIVALYLVSFNAERLSGSQTLFWVIGGLVGFMLLAALGFTCVAFRSAARGRILAVLVTVALFFGLSMGLLLLPLDIFPGDWVLLAVEIDLILLAICIAALDAFDEGEALLPDALRSLTISLLSALVFGGLVGLALLSEVEFSLLALLYATLFVSVAAQVFADSIQSLVDKLVFARLPRLRQNRAELRAAASASPRVNGSLSLMEIDETEFIRLTRRALSHFSDFNRLAASLLTRLPMIDARLAERSAPDNTLERAAELKTLLAESVTRLKPRDKGDFGTSDEWRYYNVLYFPYVLGLKPYSRGQGDDLDPGTESVLDWFRTNVPERTLHNWQNAASRLIAQDLREQMSQIGSKWQS
jgi:hypothetical protein